MYKEYEGTICPSKKLTIHKPLPSQKRICKMERKSSRTYNKEQINNKEFSEIICNIGTISVEEEYKDASVKKKVNCYQKHGIANCI